MSWHADFPNPISTCRDCLSGKNTLVLIYYILSKKKHKTFHFTAKLICWLLFSLYAFKPR